MIKALVKIDMSNDNMKKILEVEGYDFLIGNSNEYVEKHIEDSEVYITFNPNKKHIEMGKKLKWVAALSAGVDYIPMDMIKEKSIILTNGKGIHKTHMSEYVISMMINLSRNLYGVFENSKENRWESHMSQGEIYGKTIGILGLGSIGKELGKYAKLMGMKVIGTKNNIEEIEYVDKVYGKEEMVEVFKRSDFIINLLPLTEETHKIVDYSYLSAMKKEAYYINIGRGKTTNEEDLIKVLKEEGIKGAVLDVFYVEPLPIESPLWKMNNIIITPHICGVSDLYYEKAMEIIIPNLNSYRDGNKLINRVNIENGY